MENNNNEEQSFDNLWSKLQKEMRKTLKNIHNENIFIARSDAEYKKNDDFNKYIEESKEIVNNALRDDITEADDEKLTKYLNKVGINKFRYKFKEKDENDNIKGYSYSFEEDKMVVIIRDDYGKIIRFEEFNYRDHPREFFYIVMKDLSENDKDSVFFEKNKFNVSIANTVLKYFIKDIELLKNVVESTVGCNITTNNYSMIEPFDVFMNKKNFKFSKTLVKTMVEIADYETVQYFIINFGGINESMQEDMLNNALINKDLDVILIFRNEEKLKNIIPFLSIAFTNNTAIGADLVQYLLYNYYDWNKYDSIDDLISLFGCITDPRIARVVFNELLSNGCDIYNIKHNDYCHSLLRTIARSGSIEVMQYILGELSKELTIDKISSVIIKGKEYTESAFDVAVKKDNTDMIKFLLSIPGVDLDKLVKNNPKLLYYAARNDNIEIVELLLNNDKIYVNTPNRYGCTPLYMAVLNGNTEIVGLLLTRKDIIWMNKPDIYGYTPLHLAIKSNNIKIIKMLFARQPDLDINEKNIIYPNTESPLELAKKLNNREVIECLLKQQTNYNKKGVKNTNNKQNEINKQNPIMKNSKVENTNGYSMSQFEKDHNKSNNFNTPSYAVKPSPTNANINKNKYGENPLYQAISDENTEMVGLLLSNDRINIGMLSNANGESPLYTAVLKGNTEVIRLLLAKKNIIWMNRPNNEGKTPLHLAIEKGNIEIIKMLFAKQSNLDINEKDILHPDVESPLEFAIKLNNIEVIECLLEQRANYIKKEIKNINYRQKEINKQYLILKNFEMENITDYFMNQFKEGNDKSKITGI